MSSMASIAANGIGPTTCLRVWGEVRNRERGLIPEGWGWPGATIEWRLIHFGHGAKEGTALTKDSRGDPTLTMPERALDVLQSERAIAEWTQKMLRECKPHQRLVAILRFVNGKCYEDIAKQLSEDQEYSVEDVERALETVKKRIRRALNTMLEARAA